MTENWVSSHALDMTFYEGKGKWKSVIMGWAVFLVLYLVTRIPAVQQAMMGFAESMRVDWVTSIVSFLISGLIWVGLVLAIGTVVIWRRKQPFSELRIYEDGIGFVMDGREQRVRHEQVYFHYGSMQASVWIACGALGISSANYPWAHFSQADVMEKNLERYANWSVDTYEKK